MKAEQITGPVAYHGEGAVWYDGWGGLRWVDMLAGDVLALDPVTGEVTRTSVGSGIAAMIRPCADGAAIVATEREFVLQDAGARQWTSGPLWAGTGGRLNEGGCDPGGALWCGSMGEPGSRGGGRLFRLDVHGGIRTMLEDVTTSNGLGFTGDGTRMYYVDSGTGRVDVFDVGDGDLVDRRPFVTIDRSSGSPDGLWVDEEDGIWVALYGGSAVHHYSAEGVLEDVVEVPPSRVTSCTFGGPDLEVLYITTSRENLPAGAEPAAGALFSAAVGTRGRPVLTCGLRPANETP